MMPLRYAVTRVPMPLHPLHRWAVVLMLNRRRIDVYDYFTTRREAREACRDLQREQERDILWAMYGEDMPTLH
jgi:hypothetical protein